MNGILTQEERTMNIPLLKKQMECFLDSIVISGKYKSMADDEITSFCHNHLHQGTFLTTIDAYCCKYYTIEKVSDHIFNGIQYKMLYLVDFASKHRVSVSLRTFTSQMNPYVFQDAFKCAGKIVHSTIDEKSGFFAKQWIERNVGKEILLRYSFMCRDEYSKDKLCLRLSSGQSERLDLLLSRIYALNKVLRHPEDCMDVKPMDCWGIAESKVPLCWEIRDLYKEKIEKLLCDSVIEAKMNGKESLDIF